MGSYDTQYILVGVGMNDRRKNIEAGLFVKTDVINYRIK